MHVSAKTGEGVDELLEAIIAKLPGPGGDPDDRLTALIFDAQYDAYRGVVLLCRVKSGRLRKGQPIRLMHTGVEYSVEEVGTLQIDRRVAGELEAGDVGYLPSFQRILRLRSE